ncbi:MAG: hypothetical protein KF829_04565 [Ferruginibacter sp.]|nr:hypothetical protein [Ferruginibacter sp.]
MAAPTNLQGVVTSVRIEVFLLILCLLKIAVSAYDIVAAEKSVAFAEAKTQKLMINLLKTIAF